jgi:hypothetical protein
MKTMPSGFRVAGSFYESQKNIVYDPDARKYPEIQWMAKMCSHPVWAVEREYGLAPGSLRANGGESLTRQAGTAGNVDEDWRRSQNASNDIVVYWKVFSKMGLGSRLKGVMNGQTQFSQDVDATFGDYCFLAVADGIDYPLNIPPEKQAVEDQELASFAQWPIPFWLDDEWPWTPLSFHQQPDQLYPMSHMQPALGELRFINWAYSMLAQKIRLASRDFIVMLKSSSEELKESIKHGPDLTVIEIESVGRTINEMVQFLQHPTFNPEIYKMIDRVMDLFDKRTGLTDLIYGETDQQLRSAEEASVKQSATSVRPEDMAQQVEDASSALAQKEAAAARWALEPDDIKPVLGDVGAFFWGQLVQTADPKAIFQTYEIGVEQGSTRRPDRKRDTQNMQQAMQTLFPALLTYAQATGQVDALNAMVAAWGKTLDLDVSKFLFTPPPPPMPVAGPPAGGGPPK